MLEHVSKNSIIYQTLLHSLSPGHQASYTSCFINTETVAALAWGTDSSLVRMLRLGPRISVCHAWLAE